MLPSLLLAHVPSSACRLPARNPFSVDTPAAHRQSGLLASLVDRNMLPKFWARLPGPLAPSLTGTTDAFASSLWPPAEGSLLHRPHTAASTLGPWPATETTSGCPRPGPVGPHSLPCPVRAPARLLTQGPTRGGAASRPRPTLPRAGAPPLGPRARPPRPRGFVQLHPAQVSGSSSLGSADQSVSWKWRLPCLGASD